MSIDAIEYSSVSSIDTCAVWNTLSSAMLLRAVKRRHLQFILSGYIYHECLQKKRTDEVILRDEQEKLRVELAGGSNFNLYHLSVNDLREVARITAIRRLGRGEITAIVLARKMRCAFHTDDQKARSLAYGVDSALRVHTTPQMLGWLFFVGELRDSDLAIIVEEHERIEKKIPLTVYFQKCYQRACPQRLILATSKN